MYANCMQIIKPLTQLILDTRRSKTDGTYPVKIRVTYLREQHYYSTGVNLSKQEFEYVMAPKVKNAYREKRIYLDARVQSMRTVIENIAHFSFALLDSQLKQSVKDVNDIYPFFEEMYKQKFNQGKIKTASTYRTSIGSFKKFQGKIGFYDITPGFLIEYEKYMLEQGYSSTTVGINLRNLRTLYNNAISDQIILDTAVYPFKKGKYSIPKGSNIKKALDKEDIKKIQELDTFHSKTEQWARDMWLLLLYCNGINPSDLFRLKKENCDIDFISLVRKKTASTANSALPVTIFLREEAKSIINRWGDPNDPYMVKGLKENSDEEKKCKDIDQLVKQINKYMKRIKERLGIEMPCTCYTARHSFAQAMKEAGVSIEIISESLGHTNVLTTRSYLKSFRRESIKKATETLFK